MTQVIPIGVFWLLAAELRTDPLNLMQFALT